MQVELVLAIVAVCILLLVCAGFLLIRAYNNLRATNGMLAEAEANIVQLKNEFASEQDRLSASTDALFCEQNRKIHLLESELTNEKERSKGKNLIIEQLKAELNNHIKWLVSFNEREDAHSSAEFDHLRSTIKTLEEELAIAKNVIKSYTSLVSKPYIDASHPDNTNQQVKPEKINLLRGYAYELQIGKSYEHLGFFVLYSGIVLETLDRGIDLIAISDAGDRVVFIQCKNYQESSTLDYRHVKSFINSNIEHFPNELTGLIERALVCTPTTYFDAQAKEALSLKKVISFNVEFNHIYLDGIQAAIETIRNEQTKYFHNDRNESVLHLTIIDKINELRNSKKE